MIGTDESIQESPNDDAIGKFPLHMTFVREVFGFSHEEARKVSGRFGCISDLLEAIRRVDRTISASDLPELEKSNLGKLLREEIEVISFSVVSRNSVIAV